MKAAISYLIAAVLGWSLGWFIPSVRHQRDSQRTNTNAVENITQQQPTGFESMARSIETAAISSYPSLIEMTANDHEQALMIAEAWASRDPKGMLAWFVSKQLDHSAQFAWQLRQEMLEILIKHWAVDDPDAAYQAFLNVNGHLRNDGVTRLMDALFDSDPDKALELLPSTEGWWVVHSKGLERWIASDPAAAASRFDDFNLGVWRGSNYAEKVIGAWSKEDPAAAAQWATGLKAGRFAKKRALENAFKAWCQAEPVAAGEAVQAISETNIRILALKGAAMGLTKQDPEAALSFANEHLESSHRNLALATIAKEGASSPALRDAIAAMPRGSAKGAALAGLGHALWEEDQDNALHWLSSLSEPDERNKAAEKIRYYIGANNAPLITDLISDDPASVPVSLTREAADSLTRDQTPQAAFEWANALPADHAKEARNGIYFRWATTHPTQAAEFAEQLPAGEARDQAVTAIGLLS